MSKKISELPVLNNLSTASSFYVVDSGLSCSVPLSTVRTFLLTNSALLGSPTAPTPASGDNSTKIATTSFVSTALAALVNSSPSALDTLSELANALGNDANFATTVTNSLGLKAPLASPAFTGTPTAPTATAGTNTTQLATTAFVMANYNPANVTITGGTIRGLSSVGTAGFPIASIIGTTYSVPSASSNLRLAAATISSNVYLGVLSGTSTVCAALGYNNSIATSNLYVGGVANGPTNQGIIYMRNYSGAISTLDGSAIYQYNDGLTFQSASNITAFRNSGGSQTLMLYKQYANSGSYSRFSIGTSDSAVAFNTEGVGAGAGALNAFSFNSKVGIGTTAPEEMLHISGDNTRIKLHSNSGDPVIVISGPSGYGVFFYSQYNGAFHFRADDPNRHVFFQSGINQGNVQIGGNGYETPASRLTVESGDIEVTGGNGIILRDQGTNQRVRLTVIEGSLQIVTI